MKIKNTVPAIAFLMGSLAIASCGMGKGDRRDRNLERATLEHLDSAPGVEYIGMSDVRNLGDNNFSAVVIYYVADPTGSKVERNARVTTNEDCSKVYSWEEIDSTILGDTKQMVRDKLQEKGIYIDSCLIDKLIELKRR